MAPKKIYKKNNPDFLKISEEKIIDKSDIEINLTKEYETGGKNSIYEQFLSLTERTYMPMSSIKF